MRYSPFVFFGSGERNFPWRTGVQEKNLAVSLEVSLARQKFNLYILIC
jgi:hypothetical protein